MTSLTKITQTADHSAIEGGQAECAIAADRGRRQFCAPVPQRGADVAGVYRHRDGGYSAIAGV